jgi:hypothetical protein
MEGKALCEARSVEHRGEEYPFDAEAQATRVRVTAR